ncbi:MAG: ATP-dependent DNA helicase RecG [Patescibacteria group bacterium]
MSLTTPIAKLPRMQSAIAGKFAQLGLLTLRDALFYFPFRHEDWRQRSTINALAVGQEVTVAGIVATVKSRRAWHRRGTTITDVTMTDDRPEPSGPGRSVAKLHVVWFNLPFLGTSLKPGDRLYVSGTVITAKDGRLQMNNPVYERPSDDPLHQRLVPVYRTTDGLSQRQLRLAVKQAVSLANVVPDPLPAAALSELPAEPGVAWQAGPSLPGSAGASPGNLLPLPEALTQIHFPDTPDLAHRAVERLKFDELLSWHLRMVAANNAIGRHQAPVIPFHETEIRSFVQHLPYALTDDQRVAAWQVLQDLAQPRPMSRLVQGDVGSGKTVVAALVAYNAALSHLQVALVAPTVVLAEQHRQTFISMLGKHATRLALLTGQTATIFSAGTATDVSPRELRESLARGTVDIIIGTHAVLQPDVVFHRLGLVIVDEQQRFGVDQRQALLAGRDETPHFLSLTATPIPRSFALWLSGILSISTIATKPPGRAPIVSAVIGPPERTAVDRTIAATVARGEQVYVITPLIEESDSLGVRAATGEHQRLTAVLPRARVGLLHGAMPADDRLAELERFRRRELDVLVSTTVIEVGVDVPNATLMVIEGAERFGLAQLHQLRGRVGRGTAPSRCLFVTDRDAPEVRRRLERVATMTDGFAVAELDWQERGGGDLYGQRQSGLPAWRLASLNDRRLFERVRAYVSRLSAEEMTQLEHALGEDEPATGAWHPE